MGDSAQTNRDHPIVHRATGMRIPQLDMEHAGTCVQLWAHGIAANQTACPAAPTVPAMTRKLERDDQDGTAKGPP